MYYTNSSHIEAHYAALETREDYAMRFEAEFPDWEMREGYGDRFIDERDVADPFGSEATHEDWEAMAEALWVDPAERHW